MLLRKLIRVKQLSSQENKENTENLHQLNLKLQMKNEELENKIKELKKQFGQALCCIGHNKVKGMCPCT